ncbi:potassium/proton antiporter [Breznakiella homolactica]|uniref:Potassium/proton antiporter n=1 Tax=Breznakiella homolactica TaxID=2798577 RepID=A0A7T8BBI5_9SPIR|nr:potassium/proton antiporter [Breznakiella homolactica]QQO09258.1 potassium/proton antiporter [Breznakiella homolactica]
MLLLIALILIFLVLGAALFRRFNIPLIILALSLGIIFGKDVTGLIFFDNAKLTQQVADIALVFILFAGGYGIRRDDFKPIILPTTLLATVGVLITMAVTAAVFYFVSGWTLIRAVLVSAVISSTDAAAVFSILRTRSIQKKVSSITEIESAANDPMAVISTTLIIQIAAGSGSFSAGSVGLFAWQLIGGVAVGIAIGWAGIFLFKKLKDIDAGYYYIFLIALILASYSIAGLVRVSGMLSAFFAGFMLGNNKLPFKTSISSFISALSFIANTGLFILLGLLVSPRALRDIWPLGIAMFLILSFVARPAAVFLCTLFQKFTLKEQAFLSWSGIRGSVPIVLATYPLAAGLDPDNKIFNIVFLAVTLSVIFQGTTIGKFADILKLSTKERPKSKHKMELVTIIDTSYDLIEVFIDPDVYCGSCPVEDLELPSDSTITMITRNNKIIAPRGGAKLEPGDIVTLLVDERKIDEITQHIFDKFSDLVCDPPSK